jgi:hypothetical protein
MMGALVLLNVGCGAVFVGGAIQTGSTVQGSVTSVTVSSVTNGTGGTTQVTFVTFQSASSTTIGFCNDQTAQFPLNQTVTVNFNAGQFCAVVVGVIVF